MMQQAAKNDTMRRMLPPLIAAVVVILLCLALNVAVDGKFLTRFNLTTIIVSATIPTFTAWALSFIFAMNVTDFSVGAIIILSATVSGAFGNAYGLPGVVLGGMAVGIVLQLFNFVVYRVTKIPSWIAGMGLAMIYESLTVVYANARLSEGLQVIQLDVDKRTLGQYPAILIILLIGLVAAYLLYNKSTVGLNIRATGSNPGIAQNMGIKTGRTFLYCGLIAGVFFGVSGFLTESYAGRAVAATGLSSISTIFKPLAAVLLAQVMQKYINLMLSIPIATVIIMATFNVLTLMGVASGTWQEVLLGVVVIAFGMVAQRGVKGVVK